MADRHIDRLAHPTRKLGRRPPDPSRESLWLRDYLTGALPAHPAAADYFGRVPKWILGGNDRYGDCGPVSVANQRLQVSTYLTGTPQAASQDAIFDLYKRSGNPAFDPNDPGGPGDGGVEMSTMLSAVNKGGIGGIKCLAYAKVDLTDLEEVRAAIAIFGSLLFGVDLEAAQQSQTDAGLWDYQQSPEWGGHAILAGLYTSKASGGDISVVTWAEVVGTTDAFCEAQLQEAWVVIWPEHLQSKPFLEGVDLAVLAKDYKALTGRDFPAPIPPNPTPGPTPTPGPGPIPASWKHALDDFVAKIKQAVTDLEHALAGR